MALKQCNECKKEISTTVTVCPNCGSKKPFKGTKLSREETKEMSLKERGVFEKAGGKVTKGFLEKLGNIIIAIVIVVIVFSVINPKSAEENENENVNKIVKLEQTIKNIPFEKIEENLKGYKKLSEYYPNNQQYKEKYNFYNSRYNLMADCQFYAKENNKASLNNKSTYEEKWDHFSMNWNGTDQYEYESTFSGKNAFGIEQKFLAKYVCDYNNGKTLIKRVSFVKY